MMAKYRTLLLIVFALVGCVSAPHKDLPIDSGAILWDSVKEISNSSAYFYEVLSVNGKTIPNSSGNTRQRSMTLGFKMSPSALNRIVEPGLQKVAIGLFSYHKADLFGVGDFLYDLKGVVQLSLVPGKAYVVNGEANADYKAIWIEDEDSGVVVSDIVSSGKIVESDIRERKVTQYKMQIKIDRDKNNRKLELISLGERLAEKGSCDTLGLEVAGSFEIAKALFDNKSYKAAYLCFIADTKKSEANPESFKHLSIMYDVGLGVEENQSQSLAWEKKYRDSTSESNGEL
ncbi:hypothetical protein SAMN02745866_01020 [Alteromonadaceae bacterium Bs31]|nr:hypothetical protein SAMN02745866_01020 [Alteromonadaceae bacterium Bs31]